MAKKFQFPFWSIALIGFIAAIIFRFFIPIIPDPLAIVVVLGICKFLKSIGRLKETSILDYILTGLLILIFIVIFVTSFFKTYLAIGYFKLLFLGLLIDVIANFTTILFIIPRIGREIYLGFLTIVSIALTMIFFGGFTFSISNLVHGANISLIVALVSIVIPGIRRIITIVPSLRFVPIPLNTIALLFTKAIVTYITFLICGADFTCWS